MVNIQKIPLSIKPIIRYPRQAEVNQKYLMEIDIKQTDDLEKWVYEEEEYPIYCRVDTYSKESRTPLFKIQPIGKPAIVLHRFGGTYGPAKFLLTAASQDIKGEIRVTLVNGWGVPLKMLHLRDVSVTKEKIEPPKNPSKEPIFVSKPRKLETFTFEAEVASIVFEQEPPLQQWTYSTPTVNRHGEIIKTSTYTASYFTEKLPDNIDLEMVSIPGGTFTMGTDDAEIERLVKKFDWDAYRREKPQHNVTLSPFFIGKYPITQAQWNAIASRTDLKVNIDLDEDPSDFKDPYQKDQETIERWLRPVENVNWHEAVEFCQRLSKLTRRDYQLPSEAQWEYACRTAIEPLDLENDETYPPFYFGETITGELANYDDSNTYADEPKGEYREQTTPVGQFPPNAFGLYDMHGNVWEWCADDWHDDYDGAPNDGSPWLDDEEYNNLNSEKWGNSVKSEKQKTNTVLRSGSWLDTPVICRSAYRVDSFLGRKIGHYNIGFRVVCVFRRTQ